MQQAFKGQTANYSLIWQCMVPFHRKNSEAGGFSSMARFLLLLSIQIRRTKQIRWRCGSCSKVLKPRLPAATCWNLVQHKHIPGLQIFPGFLLFHPSKLRWFLKSGLDYIKGGGICFFRALPNAPKRNDLRFYKLPLFTRKSGHLSCSGALSLCLPR